jgi:hypothetical protein
MFRIKFSVLLSKQQAARACANYSLDGVLFGKKRGSVHCLVLLVINWPVVTDVCAQVSQVEPERIPSFNILYFAPTPYV